MVDKKICIVKALPAESGPYFHESGIDILYTGVGKVNAAYCLTKALFTCRPSYVVNLGTVGSSVFPAGTLVNCTQFIQRDMDATPLGYECWQTPAEETPRIFEYGVRLNVFQEAICGTGDNFDISASMDVYTVVDMEAYALARICAREEIPFYCVKYVSDGADGQAAESWDKALDEGARKLLEAYRLIEQKI